MAQTAHAPGSDRGVAGLPENTAYRHGWARVDNRIITHFGPRIGAVGLALYLALSVHADARTRTCFPSMRTISRYLQVSRPTVIKTIHTLEALGLVSVTRARTPQGRRRVNVYTLLPIPDDQPAFPPKCLSENCSGRSCPTLGPTEPGARSETGPSGF